MKTPKFYSITTDLSQPSKVVVFYKARFLGAVLKSDVQSLIKNHKKMLKF